MRPRAVSDVWRLALAQASFQNQAPLLAQFSPTQANIVVCAGAAIGAGVYYYDLSSQQVQPHTPALRLRRAWRGSQAGRQGGEQQSPVVCRCVRAKRVSGRS